MSVAPVAIVGGGPIGLTLALLLARRHVPAVVFDARTVDDARRDRRLLALSRGTLDALAPVVALRSAELAPIISVVVSSRGEFGRAVLASADVDARPLGATIRYGDLVGALDAACAAEQRVQCRRPCAVSGLAQMPNAVTVALADGSTLSAVLAVNAEGGAAMRRAEPPRQVGLIADVEVEGLAAGTAIERFTRDGPLALLPLPGASTSARPMALVWCMSAASADRRQQLDDQSFIAELAAELGERGVRVHSVRSRASYPLVEETRETVREHRLVYVGNAAQTLHPVAGQGFNLGVRDCVMLADVIAGAVSAGADPLSALSRYESGRRADRLAIGTLTRTVPGFFATRFGPVAAARSIGLTLLSIVPNFRAELVRLLMFGVRS